MAEDTKPDRVPDTQRGLNNPDPRTGESAADIEAASGKKFSHPELVVQPRREQGFNRAGIRFPGDGKTVVPANSLSEERYNAIVNEAQLVVVEKPSASLKEGANSQSAEVTGAAMMKGGAVMGGALENATPEMLEKAAKGEIVSHPSLGALKGSATTSNPRMDPKLTEAASKQAAKDAKK